MLRQNKHILFVLAALCILLIIPCSFASELDNDTLISDINDETIAAGNDVIYVDDGSTNGDGSESSPYNSISDAVNAFNSTENSNVYIKNGNYKISSKIELDKDITIVGESKEGTILDGQGKSSIFEVTTKSKITFINLTFTNAKGSGALYIDSGDNIIVDNCIFDSNAAGAIYHKSYFGDLVLNVTNSVFTKNYNDDGGAIYLYRGTLNVTNSIFDSNAAEIGETIASQGGAIYAGGGVVKTVYVDRCVFNNNTATRGSAISDIADSELYIFNSVFTNNVAPGNSRYNLNSSVVNVKPSLKEITLHLKNNTLKNNTLNNKIDFDSKVVVNNYDLSVNLSAKNVEKIYGDDFNFIIKLTDESGNGISGKEITSVFTNNYDKKVTAISNITNSQGNAIISLSTLKAGKYNVQTTYSGDGDEVTILNHVYIRTENEYNIIFEQDYISISEGDSYNVTAYIYDEYLVPTMDCSGRQYSIYWQNYNGGTSVVEGGMYRIDGNKLSFDVNRCHLITRDEPYTILFNITEVGSASVKVNLSKNTSNVDESLDVIYVSKDGSDDTGTGAIDNPLASLQMALVVNTYLNGSKTIVLGEGLYEISTFTIVENVTITGVKSKTVLKQVAGKLGMFEIESGNTVNFVNLTFTGGYSTPEPEGLIHVTDESTAYIDGCEFYENYGMNGAAIALSRHGTVYVNNSYFHDNIANTSAKVYGIGGAIYVHDVSYLHVANSLFVNNTARDGGAIFLGFGSEAEIVNSTFEDNKAIVTTLREGGGGAIFTRSSNVSIYNSTFKTNYAELYGGAIYLDYGDIEIYKSYFENNRVKRSSEGKGTAIESSYTSYSNITMHYCVVISDDDNADNYAVSIHNIDENHTADTYDNYWKVNSKKSSAGSVNEVKIQISIENEFVYTGDIVEFNVDFVRYNPENGTSPLNESVHDLALKLIPTIGNVINPEIIIKDNKAKFTYEATTVGKEVIYFENILNHTTCRFNVLDGSNKTDLNHGIDIKVNKTSTITVFFSELVGGNVTIRVNDKDYSVEIKEWEAVLEIETTPGDYNVEVIYPGDDTYKGFIDKDSFSVAKYETAISAEDITVYFNGKFQAALKGSEGNAISGEKLNININGTDYEATTDENGVATLDLNLASVGEYDVITSFAGNKNYDSSQAISKITVIYTNVKLNAEDAVVTPLAGSFTVTVTDDDGNTLNGVNVAIVINGNEYNLKTVNEGKVTVDLSDNGFDVGEYTADVCVLASGIYGASNTTAKITVEKIPLLIKTEDITVFSNNGEFIAQLVDADGNPIANKTLVFEIDSKSSEAVTDGNGQAKVALNLTSGNYSVVVSLKEDNVFKADDSIASINVNSNSVIINASDATIYSTKGKFTVELTDVNGNPISSELIVTIDGLSYVVATGADGVGSLNLTLAIGEYQVVTQFRGNNIFSPGNATSTITVLSSIESKDLKRAYKSPFDFEARLLDESGNPLANQSVSLIVNGQEYNVTTDSDGMARLNENLAVGRYAITVINPITGEETANYADIVKRITGNANVNMYYGAGKSYKVRVYSDDGKAAGAGEKVTFKINGKTYTRQTDKNGYASLKLSLKAKTYTITATYKGVKVSNKVVIKPVLTAKNISKKKAKKIKFIAKLVNTKGKAVKGKTIKFKFKGKTYKAKTNKKGIATVTLKNLKVGKYTIKTTYGKSTIKNTIKIKK